MEGLKIRDVGRIRRWEPWSMPWHEHAFHETIVVIAGGMHVSIAGEEIAASEGDVLFYPAGVPHQEASDSGKAFETIFIAWEGEPGDMPLKLSDRSGRMRTLLAWCSHDMEFPCSPELDLQHDYLSLFFKEYQRTLASQAAPAELVNAAMRFMVEHMASSISLVDIADHLGLSKFHFLREYKKQRGQTPMQDLRRIRVERARRLLITTDLPLKAIAPRVGFANAYHLGRVFKEILGVSPGTHRRFR